MNMWTRRYFNTPRDLLIGFPPFASSQSQQSQRLIAVRLAVVSFCVLLLVGCGPERSGVNSEQLETEAVRIAAEYAGDGDIGRALAQIEAFEGVANPRQWVLLLTERYILESRDANDIESLVKLIDALGMESATVSTYAAANGLLAAPVAAAEPIVVVITPIPVPETGNTTGETSNSTSSEESPTPDNEAGNGNEATETATESNDEEPVTAVLLPTPTTAVLLPTNTPESPRVRAESALNVRRGPGLLYDIVGGLQPGDQLDIVAKSDAADWWQVTMPGDLLGWVYDPLVQTVGDVNSIAVASNIPPPPEPASVEAEPVAAAPAPVEPEAEAEAQAQEEAAPPSDKPYFTLVMKRLWDKAENGGCSGQHLLRIHVLDANGNRLNGVALNNHYPPYETIVTGSQGKGDGIVEYDITDDGPGFSVVKDNDGREATSDRAEGFTARSRNIAEDLLGSAGYCNGPGLSSCAIFYESFGCNGHHSWDAEFRRNY
jgi:hypothetical protein